MKNVSVCMEKYIIVIALCGINAQAQEVIPNDTSIVETELNETSVVAKKSSSQIRSRYLFDYNK